MTRFLNISVRYLDPAPAFHGRRDGGEPEWPPSPLRLFQALLDAAANRWRKGTFQDYAKPALAWLERLPLPILVTPKHLVGKPYRLAVPNNDMDSPAAVWRRGQEPVKPHRPVDLRTMKTVRPTHLRGSSEDENAVHYLFRLPEDRTEFDAIAELCKPQRATSPILAGELTWSPPTRQLFQRKKQPNFLVKPGGRARMVNRQGCEHHFRHARCSNFQARSISHSSRAGRLQTGSSTVRVSCRGLPSRSRSEPASLYRLPSARSRHRQAALVPRHKSGHGRRHDSRRSPSSRLNGGSRCPMGGRICLWPPRRP